MRRLLVLALLLAAAHARADAEYRIAVGATNAVGAGLLTVSAFAPKVGIRARFSFVVAGLAIMTLGPPVVHARYGTTEQVVASLFAHVFVPIGGLAVGASIGDTRKDRKTPMLAGLFVGLATAAAIDLALAASSNESTSTPRMISFGARF